MNEIRLLELLGDIYRRFLKVIAPLAQAEGLSMTEMLVLWKMHIRERRRVKELVTEIGLPPSTLTGILDRLTSDGWLAREPDPDDRRAVVMSRTEKLTRFIQVVQREGTKTMEAAFKTLPQDLIERLTADLTAVHEKLEAEESRESLISSAMAPRPDVQQAVEAESAAELNRRLATAGAWPTISAHASMGFKNGILPDINVPAFNWVAGVQVSVPLFQGFLYARMGEEADKKVLAARENTIAVRRAATTQVLQALQDVKASHEQVQNAQAQLDQTKDMQDVVKLQYDLGMLSNLEYLDAQVAQERAQLGSLQARYREVLSQYALKLATGSVVWASGDTAKDPR
jgi:DNA-binding MarR family transcriptional regulator